jgi:hypothetical protein
MNGLKSTLVSAAASAYNSVNAIEMRFSSSNSEFKENLKERGVDLENIECECGEASSMDDIVSVSKDEDGVHFFCKDCYK